MVWRVGYINGAKLAHVGEWMGLGTDKARRFDPIEHRSAQEVQHRIENFAIIYYVQQRPDAAGYLKRAS